MCNVICIGDTAVDEVYKVSRLPGPDEKVHAYYMGRYLGGTTCNTAVALHNLNGSVLFITILGDDEKGEFVRKKFKELGIEYLPIQPQSITTPSTLITLAENGEKSILLLFDEYQREIQEQYFPELPLNKSNVVFSTLSYPIPDYLERFNGSLVVSLEVPTLEYYRHHHGLDIIDWVYENVHSLILDHNAFRYIYDLDATAANLASRFAERHGCIENIIVTLGSRGVIGYSTRTHTALEVEAFEIVPVDTTGAGDIFNAAYIYSFYCKRKSLEEALEFSNAVAAASCEEQGPLLSSSAISRAKTFIEKGGGRNVKKSN